MAFSSQTRALNETDREARFSPHQRSGARIYCFHFVLRHQLIAYCVPLLLLPTGANLFRLKQHSCFFNAFLKKKDKNIVFSEVEL